MYKIWIYIHLYKTRNNKIKGSILEWQRESKNLGM